MFRGMLREIVDLLDEADEARLLATEMTDPASVQDLLKYAAALEAEAALIEGERPKQSRPERPTERHPKRVVSYA